MIALREAFASSRCMNPVLRDMGQSATVAINDRSNKLRRDGHRVFKLGLGQSPFPVPDSVVEALRANATQKDYLPVPGLYALREAVADYHRRSQNVPVDPGGVMVGPGSKELMFLLQLAFQGELVVPTPAWVSYSPQARIAGRPVRMLTTFASNGWRLVAEQIDELCRENDTPRILILNYPSNPTGMTYAEGDLEALAESARRNGVVLLSDEIYGELHHRGQHKSIASYYPEGTIISGGLSKWCGAGGWRLGTFAIPPALGWLRQALATLASETFTSTSAPIQYAAIPAFRGGVHLERYLWLARRILHAISEAMLARLLDAGLHVERPDGGFYLFLDFTPHAEALRERDILGSRALCERLLSDTGVALLPGADFGRPDDELTARAAYVDFDGARAMAAAETLPRDAPLGEEFVRERAGDLLVAAERIGAWIREEPIPGA